MFKISLTSLFSSLILVYKKYSSDCYCPSEYEESTKASAVPNMFTLKIHVSMYIGIYIYPMDIFHVLINKFYLHCIVNWILNTHLPNINIPKTTFIRIESDKEIYKYIFFY